MAVLGSSRMLALHSASGVVAAAGLLLLSQLLLPTSTDIIYIRQNFLSRTVLDILR